MNEPSGPLDALLTPENGFGVEETLDQSLNSEIEKEKLEEEEEEKEEEQGDSEISEKPNVSGTSLLNPDPSLGCFPVGFHDFKPRGSKSSYTTPEENPGTKAWNYLLRINVIELLEIATTEIVHRRIPDPIDFLIEATAEARAKWQEKLLESAQLNYAEAEAGRSAAALLRAAWADDASPHGDADEADNDIPRDSYSSVVTPSSSFDLDRVSCFPEADANFGFDLQELERHLNPPGSEARPGWVCGRPPNQITSEEALKLLSYLL